jgi:hypothetical protein
MNLCVSVGVLPMSTQHFITALCSTLFENGRGSLMDDKREGRASFKTSDVVKNEVCDVIDGDRRLTVREVADKCVISKTKRINIFFPNDFVTFAFFGRGESIFFH